MITWRIYKCQLTTDVIHSIKSCPYYTVFLGHQREKHCQLKVRQPRYQRLNIKGFHGPSEKMVEAGLVIINAKAASSLVK